MQDLTTVINSFPGYEMVIEYVDTPKGKKRIIKNMYRGTDVGLGGYIVGVPGIYRNVAVIDASSMHPSSIIALNKLGKYTKRYKELKDARVFIKHRDYDSAGKLFDGKLAKYLTSDEEADALSTALKLPINSFYGISYAKFDNPARDSRDLNNIIALRGALFMRTLQDEVTQRGYQVIAIRTDSIKIPEATDEIIKFVQDFGKKYGYEMEHECTYDRMCLVNDSAYIAKYDAYGVRNKGGKHANEWTATATQFQVPYVFKTLFSHEEIIFKDMCEAKTVKEGAIYLDMNENLPDVSEQDKWLKKLDNLIPYFADPNYIPTKPSLKFISNLKEYYGQPEDTSLEDLRELLANEIAAGHDYRFVGRVGQFTPVQDGHGGGVLTCIRNGKPNAVTGTKRPDGSPYRWLESESMTEDDKNYIDRSYYRRLVDDAKEAIEEFGDFEWFVSDSNEPAPNFMNKPE